MFNSGDTENKLETQSESADAFAVGAGSEMQVSDDTYFGGSNMTQDSMDYRFTDQDPNETNSEFSNPDSESTNFGDPFGTESGAAEEEKDVFNQKKKKKVVLFVIIGLVLVLAASVAALYIREKTVTEKAEEYRNSGDYLGAAEQYGKLWFSEKKEANISAMQALEMLQNGETEKGIKQLLKSGNVVHLLYDLNGGSFLNSENMKDVSYNDPEKFSFLYNAKKDYYSFEGWKITDFKYIIDAGWNTAEIKLLAEYSPVVYTISYTNLLDGETNSPKNYTIESKTVMIREPVREGYTFTHWEGHNLRGDEKVIVIQQGETGNRTYIANWKQNVYKVTFQPDGKYDIPKTQDVTFDDNYKLPEIEKNGYSYQGWTDGKETFREGIWTHVGDVTVKPNWKLVNYKIIYDLADGTLAGSAPKTYTIESKKITLGKPTRSGYRFIGWTDGNKTEPEKEYSITPGSIGDVKVKAEWQGNPHKVTLNANGGSVSPEKADVIFGSKYSLPVPYRKGYTFTGWTAGKKNYTQGTWDLDEDITVQANWEPSKYVITLDPAGGDCSATQVNVVYGSKYSLPTPARTGYTFQGWYSGETRIADGTWEIESNLLLKASWKGNTYRISLNANGGKCEASYIDVVYGEDYELPTPYKKGYKCKGWYNGSTRYSSGKWQTASNISVTAMYDVSTSVVKYDANGGSVSPAKHTFTYGKSYTLATPTRKGYKFLCWIDKDEGLQMPMSGYNWEYETNFELLARWEGNRCNVRLNAGSGASVEKSSVEVVYGSEYSLPTPKRTGYTFIGWYDGNKKVESNGNWSTDASSITLGAKWEQSKYVIKLDPAGGSCKSSSLTVTYGERLNLPGCERKGYDFTGWQSDVGDISSGRWDYESDATLTATWSGKQYIVTLDPTGGSVGQTQITVVFGSEYRLPIPEKKGFEFRGWKSGSGSLNGGAWGIADNVAAVAEWEQEKYTLTLDAGGGTVSPREITFTYGQSVSLPQPTYEGCSFLGWICEGSSFNGVCDFDHNVTATAEWEGKEFSIIMDSDGGDCNGTVRVKFGSSYSLPEPEKEGFVFEGWYAGGSSFPSDGVYRTAKDTTVKARYSKAEE